MHAFLKTADMRDAGASSAAAKQTHHLQRWAVFAEFYTYHVAFQIAQLYYFPSTLIVCVVGLVCVH